MNDLFARLLPVFLMEAEQRLEEMDDALGALAKDPVDAAACLRLARALHTIKGNAAMMGLEPLADAAHAAEQLAPGHVCGPATLAALRDARAELDGLVEDLAASAAITTTTE